MPDLSSSQFPTVYRKLGIDLTKLGVVMLDVKPFKVTESVEDGENDLYFTPNPDMFWIKGAVGEQTAHVTLLYGLMQSAVDWGNHVFAVLDSWSLDSVEVEEVGAFPSPYPEEKYSAIIAHVRVTDKLKEGHDRLRLLPHIDTFPNYRPHITLAYVKAEAQDKWIDALNDEFAGTTHKITNINLGSKK